MILIKKNKKLVEKFILDERFILKEANDIGDGLLKKEGISLDTLAKALSDFKRQITYIDNIASNSKKINIPINNFNNLEKQLDAVKDFLNAFNELIKPKITNKDGTQIALYDLIYKQDERTELESNLTTLVKRVEKVSHGKLEELVGDTLANELVQIIGNASDNNESTKNKSLLVNTDGSPTASPEISNALAKIKKIFFDKLDELSNIAPNNINDVESILANIESIEDKNENLKKYTNLDSVINKSILESLITDIDTCSKAFNLEAVLKNSNPGAVAQELIENSDDIVKSTLNYTNRLDKELEQKALTHDEEKEKDNIEWKDRFDKAYDSGNTQQIDNVWEAFHDQNFSTIPETFFDAHRDSLDRELSAYGYSARRNPFLIYLTKVAEKNSTASELFKPENDLAYDAIHNSFVAGQLDKEDLMGANKLGMHNIIFSPKLFNKPYKDIKQYIEFQHRAVKLFPNFKYKITKNKYSDLTDFITDLFFLPGDVAAASEERVEGSTKNDLKNLADIEAELKIVFGNDPWEASKDTKEIKANKKPITDLEEAWKDIKKILEEERASNRRETIIGLISYILAENSENTKKNYNLYNKRNQLIEDKQILDSIENLIDRNDSSKTIKQKYLGDKFDKFNFKDTSENIMTDLIKRLANVISDKTTAEAR